jgi:cyclase
MRRKRTGYGDSTAECRVVGRRTILGAAVGGLATISLPPFVRTSRAEATPTTTQLTDDLAVVGGAGGNVVVLSTSSGQLLVDSGAAESAGALLATLKTLPGNGRVQTLLNTHWHLDQIGGNAILGRAGATIIAHEKTRLRLSTDYYLPAEDSYQSALPVEGRPTASFYTNDRTTFDGKRIDYGYLLEAHTDGDIYVFFRDANVVAVGDAVSPLADPALDWFGGGWLGGRVDALNELLEITDARTRFVPSVGPVVGRAEVEAEHGTMRTIFERMVELIRKGHGADDMLAAGVLDGLDRTFDDPLTFVSSAQKGLWAHHNTLSPDIV